MTVEDFVKGKIVPSFNSVGGDKEAAFDPASILVWMQVAKELIAILQQCKQAKDVSKVAADPSVWERIKLRNVVKDALGTRGWLRHGRATVDAFRKAGAELTEKEVQALYDEV
jgi:hypothetical protein